MAHDVCWLDHFLKACETTAGCKERITYLAFHRYRNDCAGYKAEQSHIGWRGDLGYALAYYRLMEKYNARGFKIKGLVWDEIGCFVEDYSTFAAEDSQITYMQEFYIKTILAVKANDEAMIEKIRTSPWIMPVGPDAHAGGSYELGKCKAIDGGANAGQDAVNALRSLVSVAWFSISPLKNHLWIGGDTSDSLSKLGEVYFEACRTALGSADLPLPAPTETAPTEEPTKAMNDEPVVTPVDAAAALDGKTARIVNANTQREIYADGQNWGSGFGVRPRTGQANGFCGRSRAWPTVPSASSTRRPTMPAD